MFETNGKGRVDDVVEGTQVATTLDGENIVIQDHEVEVATEEVSTTEAIPEDVNVNGVVLDTKVGETGEDQCDVEQVEEEVVLEVFVSEEASVVETDVSVKEVVAEQTEAVQEVIDKDPNTETSGEDIRTDLEELVIEEHQEEVQEILPRKETAKDEKSGSDQTKNNHNVDKDGGDDEIIADTIEDFVILPNEDYSESESEIVDAENSPTKPLVLPEEISLEKEAHVNRSTLSSEENVTVPKEIKSVKNDEPCEKKPEKDIQKLKNIQLLKEYGKKIYGKGALRKSVSSSEEEKKKLNGSKMKLKETTSKGKEDSVQKENASQMVEEKKTQSDSYNMRHSTPEENTSNIESIDTLEENNDATTALSELIGDIVRELSSEGAANKEPETTENNTQQTNFQDNPQETLADEHKKVEKPKETLSSKHLETDENQQGDGDNLASVEDKQPQDRNIRTERVTPLGTDIKDGAEIPPLDYEMTNDATERTEKLENRTKDAHHRKVEIEKDGDSSEEESLDEEDDEEDSTRREKIKIVSPSRSPSPVNATDESPSLDSSDKDSEKKSKTIAVSPPRSPDDGQFDDRKDEARIETVGQSESSEDEDEDDTDVRRKSEVMSPPRSPSPLRSVLAVEKVMNERDDDNDSSEDDENEAIINRKRKIMSPPRSPSPDLCEKTTQEQSKDQSSDEDSDSDEAEIRRKRIRIDSPPRSPSPLGSPQMEDLNSEQEKMLNDTNCNNEGLRGRKSSSPLVLQLDQPREENCDNADPMEIRETGSSSDDELDEECNVEKRIDITSPPRSPEPEPCNVLDRMITEKVEDIADNEKKLESSSSESEDDEEITSNRSYSGFPSKVTITRKIC